MRRADMGATPKITALRGGHVTLAAAADAFLATSRTTNPNTHRASAIERLDVPDNVRESHTAPPRGFCWSPRVSAVPRCRRDASYSRTMVSGS
ncbi:hypothetical protein FXF51_57505 [Nonomuraea sp. PA05]|nr:hypothetical protein FXF51_57505 [Nonomuraea sp. PA05]